MLRRLVVYADEASDNVEIASAKLQDLGLVYFRNSLMIVDCWAGNEQDDTHAASADSQGKCLISRVERRRNSLGIVDA